MIENTNTNPARCERCLMLRRICICSILPCVANDTQLVLIIHRREIVKPTNTGGLAARCLTNSEIHVRGERGKEVPYQEIAERPGTSLLLFPSPDATELSPAFYADLPRPVRLIVPDGNWRQASGVGKKFPVGSNMIPVSLPPGPYTRYQLRREARDRPDGLATIEAIARAYAQLEGSQVSEPLLDIFETFVQRTLWSRGLLTADHVKGGIPEL